MLIVNKPIALLGLIILFAAAFCPMLRVEVLLNLATKKLHQVDTSLFLITYSIVAITTLCFFVRQLKAYRTLTRLLFVWVLLMAVAVYFKSNHYFGLKFADNLLGKAIHFEWGWILLAIGAVLLLFSVKKETLNP